MRKQILMVAGAVVISMFAVGGLRAQSRPLEANISFAFEAGNKTMPAGNYRIESVATGAGTLQVIRNASGEVQATLSTMSIAAPNSTSAPELIFHRYGGQYFLAEIRLGDGHARELFPSRKEKELARAHAGTEVALLARGVAQK